MLLFIPCLFDSLFYKIKHSVSIGEQFYKVLLVGEFINRKAIPLIRRDYSIGNIVFLKQISLLCLVSVRKTESAGVFSSR